MAAFQPTQLARSGWMLKLGEVCKCGRSAPTITVLHRRLCNPCRHLARMHPLHTWMIACKSAHKHYVLIASVQQFTHATSVPSLHTCRRNYGLHGLVMDTTVVACATLFEVFVRPESWHGQLEAQLPAR
eukprot:350940-Chlamydomonas_euryale.AAC.3